METRAHHVLIGAFAIGVFLIALGFVLWLSKSGTERAFRTYDIVFNEAVTGLSVGGLVQYNGIKVGEVSALHLAPDDPRKVIARVRLEAATPVREDTRAKLGLQGVTGLAFIQLSGGAPDSPALVAGKDGAVPVIPSEASALSRLLASGSDVMTSVNEILMRANELLSEDNVARVAATLDHVEQLTATLAEQRQPLAEAIGQIAAVSRELKVAVGSIDAMAKSTNSMVRNDAHELLQSARQAMDSVDRLVNAASDLVDDNRAAIDNFSDSGLREVGPAIADLRATLRSLRQLGERLGNSNSILLGREQPREFQPR